MITKRRPLRAGLTIWADRSPGTFPASVKTREKYYDVVVVGAGISGALCAMALGGAGRSVLVVDRRDPASGSTSASTALVQWEIDEPLTALRRKTGPRVANGAYKASYRAAGRISRLIESLAIRCDHRRRQTLLLAGDAMNGRQLKRETENRRDIGLPSRFLTAEALKSQFGFDRDGAILSRGNCEVDPRKLTRGLLRLAAKAGVEIAAPLNVTRLDCARSGVFLELDGGIRLAAGKVVVCTGYEALPEIPREKYDLISTFALATKPLAKSGLWPDGVLVWEASDPYLYFRSTSDGRIVAGGEDMNIYDPARRDKQIEAKCARVLAKLGKLLPGRNLAAEYRWAGTFATSPTGLPVIGELDGLPNVFTVLGAGGNGITFSAVAAEIARDWVEGRAHRDLELFQP